jgi:hypothetical protein
LLRFTVNFRKAQKHCAYTKDSDTFPEIGCEGCLSLISMLIYIKYNTSLPQLQDIIEKSNTPLQATGHDLASF